MVPSGRPVRGPARAPRAGAGRTATPNETSIGVTPSLSSSSRSFRSMAAMPSAHGSPASPRVGPRSPGRSRRRGDHLADQTSLARPGVALALLRGAALEVLELGAFALEAGRGTRRPGCRAASRSALSGSISATSLVGETSIASMRCWLGSRGIVLVLSAWRVRRRGGRRARSSGRTRSGRCRWPGDRPSVSARGRRRRRRRGRAAIGREDERDVVHLGGAFSRPMNTWTRPAPATRRRRARRGRPGSRGPRRRAAASRSGRTPARP